MTIVSYAQNFEDVILWRALKHVDKGRYIDIGAWEPEIDSVSKVFYDRGWRGAHVEPVPAYAEKLRQARPDEMVIEAAIGVGTKPVKLNIFNDTGLSTTKSDIAKLHRAKGLKAHEIEVPKMSLSALFNAHGTADTHWLKIDVEGMEEEVLRSWGKHKARPWVLVIESTIPNSPIPSYDGWEPLVLNLEYQFVYFDGLSRFYLHKDHEDLRSAFGPGPNVFDDFVLSPSTAFMACSNQSPKAVAAKVAVELKLIATEEELAFAKGEISDLKRNALEATNLATHQ